MEKEENIWGRKIFFCGGKEKRRRKGTTINGEGKCLVTGGEEEQRKKRRKIFGEGKFLVSRGEEEQIADGRNTEGSR